MLWFLTEDIRWGYLPGQPTDVKALVDEVNREDLWRDAAKTLGGAGGRIPASASRGQETFFDGKVFDPENPMASFKSLAHQARRNGVNHPAAGTIARRPALSRLEKYRK